MSGMLFDEDTVGEMGGGNDYSDGDLALCPTCGQPWPAQQEERVKRRRSHLDGPIARATDPDTSHEAAASVEEVRLRQAAVQFVLAECGPALDIELVAAYRAAERADLEWPKQSESGIRTRRCELVDLGRVRFTGTKRRKGDTGRMAKEWEVIGA